MLTQLSAYVVVLHRQSQNWAVKWLAQVPGVRGKNAFGGEIWTLLKLVDLRIRSASQPNIQ